MNADKKIPLKIILICVHRVVSAACSEPAEGLQFVFKMVLLPVLNTKMLKTLFQR
jgi:hypothetical protein